MPGSIEIFPWNDNFATGIAEIDDQHRQLVKLLNQLVAHLAFQADALALEAIFDELKAYTVVHFEAEERIWQANFNGDAWATEHHRVHGDFIGKVLELRAQQGQKPLEEIIEEIVTFLTNWLAFHIIDSDKRLAKAVIAMSSGASLEEAKAIANQQMAGSMRVLISTVMGMYDKLASRTIELTREMNRRVKAEQELRAAQDELVRLRDEAVSANEAKSLFLANMSHEIRSPLNSITGMVHLIKRSGIPPAQEDRLDKIDAAGQHLLGIVDAILDLSKIEAGKLVIEHVPLRVQELLDDVSAILGDRAIAKHLVLAADSTVPAISLLGDPTRIRQALLNYATNAIKFTESGRVLMRARVDRETADGLLIRFEVQDTGIGIAPEAQVHLFSPFVQADESTARMFGGTGLGLTITRRLAELMGGEAGVTSVAGTGSTFWFTVLLKKNTAPPEAHAGSSVSGDTTESRLRRLHSDARILLVEDDPINQEVSMSLLEEVGLKVEIANDGVEALEQVTASRFDLILMDMQMPRMDGLEATRRIRTLPNGATVPIVAMTANAFAEDRARCFDAGMDDFISKPVDPAILFETLLNLLGPA